MTRKILIFTLFFYFLALWQTSFLVHFKVLGLAPLILIAVILINLLENTRHYSGIFAAFVGGFFLDIFSSGLIGFYVLILVATAILIKIILRNYVWSPIR